KAIEDAAMGTASVYRSLELPLPRTLPYANRELRQGFAELLARVMPFDLVIDEHTADGQEVRVSRTSVAGSWGAVAGTIRFFADRFGVPRASIEGTTISYELVRRNATLGPPSVIITGPRKHQQLAVSRRLTYFGFELATDLEPLEGSVPAELRDAARHAVARALIEGETGHADQGRIRRAVEVLREWWKRSGGMLTGASDEAILARLLSQLSAVVSWKQFLETPLALDPQTIVPDDERRRLDALPSMARIRGDAVPLDYEVESGGPVARLRLREGQARRLTEQELPRLDRPLRFAVARSGALPIRADSLAELKRLLALPSRRAQADRRRGPPPRRGGRRR
ncbi:MAG TPA: DEAD/DEAH box helicase, partial [Gemmatimonadales bacterium]